MPNFTKRNLMLAAGAGAIAIGGAAAWFLASPQAQSVNDDLSQLGKGIDGVELKNGNGERVVWRALQGKPRALFFGFTHCPVICPVTVYELTAALERIGADGRDIGITFVTIDPERDTPEKLLAYFSGFGPRVSAYTGTPEAVADVARAFDITYEKVPLEGGEYNMNHTATVFLLDADGSVRDVIAYGSAPDVVDARLRTLVAR